jgi:aspartate/methionine/tyrosine aminotransferase
MGLRVWAQPYADQVRVDLSDSATTSLTLGELAALTNTDIDALVDPATPLSYPTAGGSPELRELIGARYGDAAPDSVVVTAGAGDALASLALLGTANTGHVVVEVPAHESLLTVLDRIGCRVDTLPAPASVDRILDSINEHTGAVFLTSPHNPTGRTLSPDEIALIASRLEPQHGLLVVDEVFRGVGVGAPVAPSAVELAPNAVSVGSLSKVCGLPGLRIGWVVGSPLLVDGVRMFGAQSSRAPATISESIALVALRHHDALIERTRALVLSALGELAAVCERHTSVTLEVPSDGIVAFPRMRGLDDTLWCGQLVESTGLLVAPGGACFGLPGHIRVNLAATPQTWQAALPLLDQAFERSSANSLTD